VVRSGPGLNRNGSKIRAQIWNKHYRGVQKNVIFWLKSKDKQKEVSLRRAGTNSNSNRGLYIKAEAKRMNIRNEYTKYEIKPVLKILK
jgi:hypothetical protein